MNKNLYPSVIIIFIHSRIQEIQINLVENLIENVIEKQIKCVKSNGFAFCLSLPRCS